MKAPSERIAVFRDVVLDVLGVKGTDRKRWVIHALEGTSTHVVEPVLALIRAGAVGKPVKEDGESTTVITHGYGNGLGFYFQNLEVSFI